MPLLVQFDYGTLDAYNRSSKNFGTLFFTEDTNQLFRGSEEITKTAKVVDVLPDSMDGEFGCIYIKMPEMIPYIFTGSEYVRCIKEYTSTISDKSTDDQIPTAKAVYDCLSGSSGSGRKVVTLGSEDFELSLEYLPDNGSDILYKGNTLKSVTFDNFVEQSGSIADDYWARMVFKKGSSVMLRDIVVNEEIKILNPDLNISNYMMIHILLTYDGSSVCCIGGGY